MKRISLQHINAALRNTIAAAVVTLTAIPAAFAETHTIGLEKLLAEPTSFVAVTDGAPGKVTFASMTAGTLALQFSIPTHSGDMFGEIVGKVDAQGVFHGNSLLISENGQGQAVPVTLIFDDYGAIATNVKNGLQASGFMTAEMFNVQ
jgi:hypothetical protein